MLLTSKSLQFLSVIPVLSQPRFLSTGIFSSYVPKGLLHSSCPKRLSRHVLLLSGWLHIGSQRLSTLVRQKVLAVQKTKQNKNSIAMFILIEWFSTLKYLSIYIPLVRKTLLLAVVEALFHQSHVKPKAASSVQA